MLNVAKFLEEFYRRSIGVFYQCAEQFQISFLNDILTFIDQSDGDSASSIIGVDGQTVDPAFPGITTDDDGSDKAFLFKGTEEEIRVELHFLRNCFFAVSTFRLVREISNRPEVHDFIIICCCQSSDLQS